MGRSKSWYHGYNFTWLYTPVITQNVATTPMIIQGMSWAQIVRKCSSRRIGLPLTDQLGFGTCWDSTRTTQCRPSCEVIHLFLGLVVTYTTYTSDSRSATPHQAMRCIAITIGLGTRLGSYRPGTQQINNHCVIHLFLPLASEIKWSHGPGNGPASCDILIVTTRMYPVSYPFVSLH